MKKNERIEFRVTPDELEALKNIAGPRNVAGYIRSRIPELANVPIQHGNALPPEYVEKPAKGLDEERTVAPKPVEKPRDPQPESDYRRIRHAGLRQRKL